ncbi:MAG TPA: hypothetical protein VGN26_10305 [Armatimonadota bacterium]|jgi:hypothetical protein
MDEARAFFRQALSDLGTAQLLGGQEDGSLRCQSISKCQQCVEKSLKSLDKALAASGIITWPRKRRGHPVAEIAKDLMVESGRLLSALRLAPAADPEDLIVLALKRLEDDLPTIEKLDCLVPTQKLDFRGLAARNTEYPISAMIRPGWLPLMTRPSKQRRSRSSWTSAPGSAEASRS